VPPPDRRRRFGRAIGAIVALVALTAFVSPPWGPTAAAQTVTDSTTPSPEPTAEPADPSPTASPSPEPTDDPAPSGSPTGGTWSPPGPGPTGGPSTGSGSRSHGTWTPTGFPPASPDRDRRDGRDVRDELDRWKHWRPTPGTFDTGRLDAVASHLRERGWTERRIQRQVYAPFILVGPATWSDSWGALRLVAGPRPHHGQDVLCTYGAPVLATEHGTVSYDTGTLGGLAAYLHRDTGGFFYYAHLSATAEPLPPGGEVERGDVIGYCGASGNASVPHVHFSYVSPSGRSIDPMPFLRQWLRAAERDLPRRARERIPLDEPVIPGTWSPPPVDSFLPPEPEPTAAEPPPAGDEVPPELPMGAALLTVPLLGLLRWRTRERQV